MIMIMIIMIMIMIIIIIIIIIIRVFTIKKGVALQKTSLYKLIKNQ